MRKRTKRVREAKRATSRISIDGTWRGVYSQRVESDSQNHPLSPACPEDLKFVRLADLPRRARAVVVGHGTDGATAERLSALGLGLGASFTIVQSGARPTVLVGATRIGLGPELASAVKAFPR